MLKRGLTIQHVIKHAILEQQGFFMRNRGVQMYWQIVRLHMYLLINKDKKALLITYDIKGYKEAFDRITGTDLQYKEHSIKSAYEVSLK